MPAERNRIIVEHDGHRVVVAGRAAAMALLLAKHQEDVNQHADGAVEFNFGGGQVKCTLKASLDRVVIPG